MQNVVKSYFVDIVVNRQRCIYIDAAVAALRPTHESHSSFVIDADNKRDRDMECRQAVVSGGVLRSPPSASALPLTKASNPIVMRNRGRRHSRSYDCGDNIIVDEYNNNSNVTFMTTINNTTQLIDELEQLRTDNFQLRLRVYNAERRVDRLSAAALAQDQKRCSDISDTESDDTDASSGHAGSGTDHNAAAKATAEAAVRTIHDLLTVNRRLLALLAATVSAKAVSVSTEDKRRWQRLRNQIEKYATDDPIGEKTNEDDDDNDDEFRDVSATESETSCRARKVSVDRSATRQNSQRSPPLVPQQSPPPTTLETTGVEDEGAGSEVSRLRGRCRRLERSLQQLVNTELWARNRQIGKLEQQRYVTQAAQRDKRLPEKAVVAAAAAPPQQHHLHQQIHSNATASAASPQATKGILVIRTATETPCSSAKTPATACMESQTAAVSSPPNLMSTITTPPSVLPDYSEVNFFFSCDEEDDDNDDRREDSAETNCTLSSPEETADSNDCRSDEEPVRLAAVDGPVESSTTMRIRYCRPHHRQPQQAIKCIGDSTTGTTTISSSTESTAAEDEVGKINGSGVIMTSMTATSPCATRRYRTVSGGGGLHRRRRCRPPRRCSTCGRCNGSMHAAVSNRPRSPSVADAQVQCGDENVAVDHSCNNERGDSELQLQQLRRELDARRRENSRLYDMLLKLQRGTRPNDRGNGDGGPRIPSPDFSDSDPSGSPEPYRQTAGVVHDRVAELLPPLLSIRSISDDDNDGGGESYQRYRPDGAEQQQHQQQQQLQLLTRLRERIVAYERRELNGGDDRVAAVVQQSTDVSDDAVRSMDRTDLVNVALPRVVERLRLALVPLLQHRTENAESVNGGR